MLNINSLPVISFANIFSYSVCCLFILLMVYCLDYYSFVVQSEFREPDSSSSIFLSEATGYSESFASLGRFIPTYFILSDVMVNGIVSLISFSEILLLVYGSVTDFWIFIFFIMQLY